MFSMKRELGIMSSDEVNILDLNETPKFVSVKARNLRRIGVVLHDQPEVEDDFPGRHITALRADVCVIVIADAGKCVVGRAVFGVKVNRPVLRGARFESTEESVGVVVEKLPRACCARWAESANPASRD